jgi:hypothetical protein
MALPLLFGGAALGSAVLALAAGAVRWLAPLFTRGVLLSLGIGFVAYLGVDVAVDAGFDVARASLNGVPVQLLEFVKLLGVFDAFEIIAGGVTTGIALKFTLAKTDFTARMLGGGL